MQKANALDRFSTTIYIVPEKPQTCKCPKCDCLDDASSIIALLCTRCRDQNCSGHSASAEYLRSLTCSCWSCGTATAKGLPCQQCQAPNPEGVER